MAARYVPYLTLFDYPLSIQNGQLFDQLFDSTGDVEGIRKDAEKWAMGIFRSKIGSNFDFEFEFTPTLPYAIGNHAAGTRVIIDFPEYDGEEVLAGECRIYEGKGYLCNFNTSGDFDESKWTYIGDRGRIWSVDYPYPVFSLSVQYQKGELIAGQYEVGDKVWWNNHIWECLTPTLIISQEAAIQYRSYGALPAQNVFPKIGGSAWKDLGEWYETEYPRLATEEDLSPWIYEDNRDSVTLRGVIDLAIFKMHDRISPNNIPTLRINNMRETLAWLSEVKLGNDIVDIPENQPSNLSDRIRWGGAIKKTNGY